jgi:hypothetical protein
MPPCSMPLNNFKKTTNANGEEEPKVQTQTALGQSITDRFEKINIYNIMNILLGKNKVVKENRCNLEKKNLENCINNQNDCTEFMLALKQCQKKN